MKNISRNFTNKLNYILDDIVPPFIRDSKLFMRFLYSFTAGEKYSYYMKFKEKVPNMADEQVDQYYSLLADTFMERQTDCNSRCEKYILDHVYGEVILDVGGGSGYLAGKIFESHKGEVYLLDVVKGRNRRGVKRIQGSICDIPFEDNFFDTVICTHTLEHIKDNKKALEELRRVCRKKLIIVLPRQREYKYTFDLHLHFFPYEYNVRNYVGSQCKIYSVGGDWLIVEHNRGSQ